jgi:aldehyde:ferredoxin oxidoreductase
MMPEAGLTGQQDYHASSGKGFLAKIIQDYDTVVDSSIFCLFTTCELGPADLARALTAATGLPYDAQAVLRIGERIFNLQRAFNNRLGIRRSDDTLPKRVLTSTEGGPNEGFVPNLDEQLDEYYRLRGWEADGKPSKARLQELGLDFVISDLYA